MKVHSKLVDINWKNSHSFLEKHNVPHVRTSAHIQENFSPVVSSKWFFKSSWNFLKFILGPFIPRCLRRAAYQPISLLKSKEWLNCSLVQWPTKREPQYLLKIYQILGDQNEHTIILLFNLVCGAFINFECK